MGTSETHAVRGRLTRGSVSAPRFPGDTNDNKPMLGAEEEVAKMGCPCLGEHTRLEVVIEESYEFKVTSRHAGELESVAPRNGVPGMAFFCAVL